MDSQGANRKLGSRILGKDWSGIVDISIVPFPYWYHFLILIVKNSPPLLDPSKIRPKGCPRSIPAVRGMYDRYPLGWPGGSPAPNLVAWIDETIRESIPDGFWDVPFFFGYQASQQGFSREFPWK